MQEKAFYLSFQAKGSVSTDEDKAAKKTHNPQCLSLSVCQGIPCLFLKS